MDVLKIFTDIVKRNETYAKELNTRQQLFDKGIRADNTKIEPGYSTQYKKRKLKLGLPTGHVSLYLTGNYHQSFEITNPKQDEIDLGSTHKVKGFDLANHLRKVYGQAIEGLTPENEEKFWNKIQPQFMAEFEKQYEQEIDQQLTNALNDL